MLPGALLPHLLDQHVDVFPDALCLGLGVGHEGLAFPARLAHHFRVEHLIHYLTHLPGDVIQLIGQPAAQLSPLFGSHQHPERKTGGASEQNTPGAGTKHTAQ